MRLCKQRAFCVAALLFSLQAHLCVWSQVGVAPVYDGSGDRWGPTLAQYLTLYVFEELEAKGASTLLLNPGGVYTPADTSWLVDYAQEKPEIKYLLATTLQPAAKPEHGKWTLELQAELLDSKSGAVSSTWKISTDIKGKDTDVFTSFQDPNAGWKFGLTTGYREFRKSPLGKAAQDMAEQLWDHLRSSISPSAQKAAAPSGSGSCPMHVRITYGYRHAASKSYTLLVNGLDQSSTIRDGVASFTAEEGNTLVQFSVQDTPYKLAKQELYQFSTMHSCSKGTYVIDLAKSGDAHDRWE